MKSLWMVAALVAVGLAGCTEDEGEPCAAPSNPDNPRVMLETTMGNMTAEVFSDIVPVTGGNFVALVESGAYDGSMFHRIIANFMTQGGDYTRGDGTGGRASEEFGNAQGNIPDEYSPLLCHDKAGMFSMANRGPNTGSSQFFITFDATPHLDAYVDGELKACGEVDPVTRRPNSCHAVFASLVDGFDVLERINAEAASSSGTPRTPVELIRASVI